MLSDCVGKLQTPPTKACLRFVNCRDALRLLLCGRDFRGGVGVFLREAFHAAGGVNQLLLAGEEWVAIGADFDVELFTLDGRTGGEIVAAGAMYGYGVIVGVNTGFHEKSSILSRPVCTAFPMVDQWVAPWREDTAASLGRVQAFDYTIRRKDSPPRTGKALTSQRVN